jgi:flagellar motor switch protein FliG
MESFQDKFRQLDRIMVTQLSEFADIVMTMAKVTEMSHYPKTFLQILDKVTRDIPTQLDQLATDKMFVFLDILKLQRQFLNDMLTLPEVTFIPGAMDVIVNGHDTLDAIQSKVTELAFMGGGE